MPVVGAEWANAWAFTFWLSFLSPESSDTFFSSPGLNPFLPCPRHWLVGIILGPPYCAARAQPRLTGRRVGEAGRCALRQGVRSWPQLCQTCVYCLAEVGAGFAKLWLSA